MTSELVAWVGERIAADGLDDEVGLLVLAAMEGESELDAYLDSDGAARTGGDRVGDEPDAARAVGGTFLESIEVEGFRGIGPATALRLKPEPGLTIIAGRNGSGKSSLAEALELVLTGGTYRWENKNAMWKETWRNLHHDHARITVRVVEEGSGPVDVSVRWTDGSAELGARSTTVQRTVAGVRQPQETGTESLGWARPLEQFRPMLSYDELGGLLENKPSMLYDALAAILGVEQLGTALSRIQGRLKARRAPATEANTTRRALQAEASALEDERAAAATRLLKCSSPDTAALRRLVTGAGPEPAGPVAALRALASVGYPSSAERVSAAAATVRAAVAQVADSAGTMSARELAGLELLESALTAHATHGDMPCPVCRQGSLDDAWVRASTELAARSRKQLTDYDRAQQALRSAVGALRALAVEVPAPLRESPVPETHAAVSAARTAWDAFRALPAAEGNGAHLAAADHVDATIGPLLTALDEARVAAAAALEKLDDAWRPLASRIAAWCVAWDDAAQGKAAVDRLATAEKWLKENDRTLKNERMAPIEAGAKHAWSKLRQESDVEIGSLTLEGTATRRHVKIAAAVNGEDAGSIAVLSQGELHALALALFLPRATMSASPFRFLVLDDPIQAMDPAKVDGLVELLGDLARDRQVVVLSHDDRLPAAVRRSSLEARVLEVSRAKDSRVFVSALSDPASRYLRDAFGLVTEWDSGGLAEPALRRTLPGLLRFAVESAAKDRYYTRALAGGALLADVERRWLDAPRTRDKVALAVVGEEAQGNALAVWADAKGRAYRANALRTVGPSMHHGLDASAAPLAAAREVEKLVDDIRRAP